MSWDPLQLERLACGLAYIANDTIFGYLFLLHSMVGECSLLPPGLAIRSLSTAPLVIFQHLLYSCVLDRAHSVCTILFRLSKTNEVISDFRLLEKLPTALLDLVPARPPPPGETFHFDNPPNLKAATIIALSISGFFPILVVLLRFLSKSWTARRLFWDDCQGAHILP